MANIAESPRALPLRETSVQRILPTGNAKGAIAKGGSAVEVYRRFQDEDERLKNG